MDILKRLKFLDRNSVIINNVQKATKAYVKYDKDYLIEATIIDYHSEIDMYKMVKDVVALGKQLYNCNKDKITKIKDSYGSTSCTTKFLDEFGCKVGSSIEPFKYDYLIFNRNNSITEETANIVKKWCDEGHPTTFVKSYTNFNNQHKDTIDIHSLIDISIFMYLLLSAINNENIEKIDDYAKKQKLKINSNGVSYEDIVDNYIDEKDNHHSYGRIISYLNFYENNALDLIRPIIKETTRLYLAEEKDSEGKNIYKPKLTRCFENVYSFYIFVIKMAIYAAGNDFSIINMCGCGNVIDGKADLCPDCFRMFDVNRKKNQR